MLDNMTHVGGKSKVVNGRSACTPMHDKNRPMSRFFNTSGPCRSDIHYTLASSHRLPLVRDLIESENYFVLHAPRQVGKTTTLMNLAVELTAEGRYAAVLVSMESGAAFPEDIGAAEYAVLGSWRRSIAAALPPEWHPPVWPEANPGERIAAALAAWCAFIARPLVLFLDEIDSLEDHVLLSVLRQLRSGFPTRPKAFPWSLGLVGLRDVRDYKVKRGESDRLHTASPFNIKAESLTLGNFTREETGELLTRHTIETGQRWDVDTRELIYTLTQGQPWLVNALARQCVEVLVKDRSVPITPSVVLHAKAILLERQDTHLDSLAERLREPRVAAVMQAVLSGEHLPFMNPDDLRYVLDLGLLVRASEGSLEVANPIYHEVIPKVLTTELLASIPRGSPTWLGADGKPDPEKLLASFIAFWKQHGEPMMKSAPYHEAAPHLVMLAFLSKVVNGGGRVEREYAVGTGRMDLLVHHGNIRVAMELKVWRDADDPDPLEQGLEQLEGYLEGLELPTGWLVVFDRRPDQPRVAKRTRVETATTASRRVITVVRG